METAHDPVITRTTTALTVTVSLKNRGGVHRSMTFRMPLDRIRDADMEAMIQALGDETARRLRERWAPPDDMPLW